MKNLKLLRKSRHLSQSELSQLLHISQQSICKYEGGHSEANETLLIKIAGFFGTTVDYLLGLSDSPEIPPASADANNTSSTEEAFHMSLYRNASREQKHAVDTLLKSCVCEHSSKNNIK